MKCKHWKNCKYYFDCVTCNSDRDARGYCGKYKELEEIDWLRKENEELKNRIMRENDGVL